MATRTWQFVMDEMAKLKRGETQARHVAAVRDPAFDLIRNRVILETQAEHFLRVLQAGSVSTNVFLRRIHNFALDMNWLPWPALPKKRWPAPAYKAKRATRWEEHLAIVAIVAPWKLHSRLHEWPVNMRSLISQSPPHDPLAPSPHRRLQPGRRSALVDRLFPPAFSQLAALGGPVFGPGARGSG